MEEFRNSHRLKLKQEFWPAAVAPHPPGPAQHPLETAVHPPWGSPSHRLGRLHIVARHRAHAKREQCATKLGKESPAGLANKWATKSWLV